MRTGAGQYINYAEQVVLRTEFMCLVISLDRLLAVGGSNFISADAFIWLHKQLLTFQASSKSIGKMTYRFLRTAVVYVNHCERSRSLEYLVNRQLERLRKFQQMISDLAVKHLNKQLAVR